MADIFTKPLGFDKLQHFSIMLGLQHLDVPHLRGRADKGSGSRSREEVESEPKQAEGKGRAEEEDESEKAINSHEGDYSDEAILENAKRTRRQLKTIPRRESRQVGGC